MWNFVVCCVIATTAGYPTVIKREITSYFAWLSDWTVAYIVSNNTGLAGHCRPLVDQAAQLVATARARSKVTGVSR
jgi:hypothetical protein